VVDLEAAADGGDGMEVAGVGADDQVPAAQRALVDACVDDVGGRGLEAHSGSADTPWLQFWLQFVGVLQLPTGFTCPGQDAGEPT
jgi:hypothetical protein